MIHETLARFRRLDVVVNNAGVALAKNVVAKSPADRTSAARLKRDLVGDVTNDIDVPFGVIMERDRIRKPPELPMVIT